MNEDLLKYSSRASWIEVSSEALVNNIEVFRKLIPSQCRLGVVLKGNAYGHGLEAVLPAVHSHVDLIYVITPQDAFRIRLIEKSLQLHPRRVLVIGSVSSDEVLECARQDIEVVLGDLYWIEYFSALQAAQLSIKIHLHVDTGLSREGFFYSTIDQDLAFLKNCTGSFRLQGIMSHFANTEDVTEQTYAHFQIKNFREGVSRVKALLSISDPIEEHIAASAATLVIPQSHLSNIRLGISLYGLWPSTETRISSQFILQKLPQFKAALSWKCKSQIIKWIKKGSYVGYGCTFRCSHDTQIAVLPVGYYDGYPRLASGKAHVLVHQRRCRVIGRVMMNHIIIDISDLTVDTPSIEAILIGQDGDEVISAEMLAEWAETINYEVVGRLGPHLKRISIK